MSAPIPERWQELYAACKDGRYTSSMRQIEAIEQIAALSQANEQLFEAGEKTYQNFVRAADQIAALQAQNRALRDIKSRLDHRLNEHLCEMKSECDDSITGFNEAWDIMRGLFRDVDAALAATEPEETA